MQISDYLSRDHRRCDQFFATLEGDARSGNWARVKTDLETFVTAMERHFGIEENEVFPALTAANAMWSPPTEVMRREHKEMRELFEDLEKAVGDEDTEAVLGLTETLLFTMQVHNAKEENILYRMVDKALGGESEPLLKRIEDWANGAAA